MVNCSPNRLIDCQWALNPCFVEMPSNTSKCQKIHSLYIDLRIFHFLLLKVSRGHSFFL